MAIIAFWSEEKRETGQTLSMAGLITQMAVKHNYRVLGINTGFRDKTLEDCYFDPLRVVAQQSRTVVGMRASTIGVESGMEGLTKIVASNKTDPNLVRNYTKVVFNSRLDILPSPVTMSSEEYKKIIGYYPDILQMANKAYDFVFIDVSKQMPAEMADRIIKMADIVVINLTQRLRTIKNFLALREKDDFFKRQNLILNMGRYDQFSKYNKKNVTRFLRERKEICAVPYNTLFFEACSESRIAEYFMKLRRVDPTDRNAMFIKDLDEMINFILQRLKEIQVKI